MANEQLKEMDEKTKRSLKFATIEGGMYSVMSGLVDNFISPFAIALGAGNFAIGMIRSLPPLIVSIAQPFGLRLSAYFDSRKSYIRAAVFIQAIFLLLLLSIPFLFRENFEIMLLIFFSLFSITTPLVIPAWTSWMADIVPEKIRGTYFGNRNMIGGIATFLAILAAGFILSRFNSQIFLGFAIIFVLATIFRMLSFASFSKIYEPAMKYDEKRLNIFAFVAEIKNNDFGVFLLYYCSLIFSTSIAGFFFSVYMIRDLGISYEAFAIIESSLALSALLANRYWGKIIDKFGNKLVLSVCGLLVPFVPLLWLTTKNPFFLLLFEIFSGFAWAGMNLAIFNYVIGFGSLKNKTAQYTANFNFFQGISVFLGALLGTFLVTNADIFGYVGIPLVFLISGILRLLSGFAFLPLVKEYKSAPNYRGNALFEFALFMPARNIEFYVHQAYDYTYNTAKKAVKKIKYKI